MRVHIPENVKKIIDQHRVHGDFSSISRRLTANPDEPDGDESRSQEVASAVNAGSGKFDVVKEICLFYTEKEKAIKELSSIW